MLLTSIIKPTRDYLMHIKRRKNNFILHLVVYIVVMAPEVS
jgi:hypothetical protein